MTFDALPAMVADLLQEQRTTNDRLATMCAALAAAIQHAYEIKAANEAAASAIATAKAPETAPAKEKRASKKTEAAPVVETPVAATPAPVEDAPLPAPATPPAQVKPSDVDTDRARIMALAASIDGGRSKALAMVRRDDPAAKVETLSAARRAEIIAELEKLAG